MSDTKRLRRPPAGGYARGDETRLRIIEAAIGLFGEHGFEGASTRDIAARADVNAPALQYYFENKEGLYRACAEYIAATAWEMFGPVIEHARAVLDDDSDTETLIDAFIRIQEVMADKMLSCPQKPDHRLFFAREQLGQEPGIASEVLQERLRTPFNRVGAELVARITGTAVDDPVTLIRMMSLHGQLLLFHVARRSALVAMGWDDIDAEKGELIKTTVRTQTRALLEQWSRERQR
jgi:AcrR family transcriptional regulator